MATLANIAPALLGKVKSLEEKLTAKLGEVQAACDKLSEAGSKVEESWSGSSIGYHAELHYGDFEKPPLNARFNPEWGGMNGLPSGRKARTAEQVKERIEKLAGFDFETLEKETATVLGEVKALHTEIVTELSILHTRSGLDREKELLNGIEHFEWGKTIGDYMKANWSTGFMSRDSHAISQGTRVPAHLYYTAVAYQCETRSIASREFLSLSARLLRQIELNAASSDVASDADQQPVKAVLAICDRFHQVARQLTHRRESDQRLRSRTSTMSKIYCTRSCGCTSTMYGPRSGHLRMVAGRLGWISC